MKLECYKCGYEVDVIVVLSGPHKKGICPAGHYLKFLSKAEMKQIEAEEDAKHGEKDGEKDG